MDMARSIRFKKMWADRRDELSGIAANNLKAVNEANRLRALRGGDIPEGCEDLYRFCRKKGLTSCQSLYAVKQHKTIRKV